MLNTPDILNTRPSPGTVGSREPRPVVSNGDRASSASAPDFYRCRGCGDPREVRLRCDRCRKCPLCCKCPIESVEQMEAGDWPACPACGSTGWAHYRRCPLGPRPKSEHLAERSAQLECNYAASKDPIDATHGYARQAEAVAQAGAAALAEVTCLCCGAAPGTCFCDPHICTGCGHCLRCCGGGCA
jgi:hypothetical protein